ncbi:MAG: cytidylyltransferase domain-containing protein [Gammaproteobacteria bacterium]
MRWVAFMPLRAGSKGIADKNTRCLAGKPLFSWSLQQALASGIFDAVYVATDSDEIRQAVLDLFPEQVTVVDRSPESSSDTAGTESVMLEFQAREEFDMICLIQATSPLTRAIHFQEARKKIEAEQLDSLLSVAPLKRFLWQADGVPVNYDPAHRPRRQDFAGELVENGAFYFTRAAILREQKCRIGGKTGVYRMPADTALEIDEPADWAAAEYLLLQERWAGAPATAQIKALILDVDGTLTDGGMYYNETGEAMKKFDTRDAKGINLLREQGLMIAIITAEDSAYVTARMNKLGIEEYHKGISDKLPLLKQLAAKWDIPLQQIAYIGDDVGDKPCLQAVGFAACPGDAVPEIKRECDYITQNTAGDGAVREVCDVLLAGVK